jgi:hypothetical protein
MIVASLNLFQLFPLYGTPYFITERLDIDRVYPSRLNTGTDITSDTWQRYGDLSGYDVTNGGVITCADIATAKNTIVLMGGWEIELPYLFIISGTHYF